MVAKYFHSQKKKKTMIIFPKEFLRENAILYFQAKPFKN